MIILNKFRGSNEGDTLKDGNIGENTLWLIPSRYQKALTVWLGHLW